MRPYKILFIASAIVTLASQVSAVCKYVGKKCPEETPCCNGGWCSNNPAFCSTGCQPENSFSPKSCYPKPGCRNFYDDFSKDQIISINDYNGDPNSFKWTSDFVPDNHAIDKDGNLNLNMYLNKNKTNDFGKYQGFGVTISTTRWMQYGLVTARIKTAGLSKGVVSSMVISNNTADLIGDEIDYEWVGLNKSEVQSNYYWNGTLDYTKGKHHYVAIDTTAEYFTYFIDWKADSLSWGYNGKVVRTVYKKDTCNATDNICRYPTEMSRVAFSIWDGGMGAPGTADWAGTPTDWSDNKFYTMYVDWVNVTCYNETSSTSWPPEGYGTYTTVGVNQPTTDANEENQNESSPGGFKKYVVPVGAVLGSIVATALIFGVYKHYTKGEY
ncbi:10413_t:CDS:2 [Diversispora eburnea]|uniref:10413_t:CDS:1 n=1 Tax=Diversispora eburnea TaxID=1213867 RepID=A0A9N8V3P6_9GLOM|nr:10413_t:CDS:2 [Diversispora eburnea]